jgi:amino acid adenylation domain-containing protein
MSEDSRPLHEKQANNLPPALELPIDGLRSVLGTYRASEQAFELPPALSESLHRLAEEEGIPTQVVLLAAFQALLHRYSGQEEVVVHLGQGRRGRLGVCDTAAPELSFRPVHTRVSYNLAARRMLARVHTACRVAEAHGETPTLNGEAETHHAETSHYQAGFVWLNSSDWPRLSGQPAATDRCELCLVICQSEQGLSGLLRYDSELFAAATAARMAEHFQVLLQGLAADPDAPVCRLPMFSGRERRQILVDWNATAADFPVDTCLHELFEAQVVRTPEATALVHGEQELTYAELNRRADVLAGLLRGRGVRPDVLVAIRANASFDMIVGILGVLKAGGAYVPIDPATPAERLRFLLEDTRAPVLLTQRPLAAGLADLPAQVLLLDDLPSEADAPADQSKTRVTADSLAYVIYTSGSTGTPKGVMIPHRGICNTLHWRQQAFPLRPDDRVLQTFSFTFDASLWELFAPLVFGARLVLAGATIARDTTRLVELIAQHGITAVQAVPSRLGLLLAERGLEECRRLRHVICGGEALTRALQDRFFTRLPAALHNLYGPTETAVDATFWTCRPDERQAAVPIGRAIANKRLYLLDRNLRPVPVGVPGELYIGGAGVARGYLGNPALTASRFVPDPFSPVPGARMYRTGDGCRWLADGNLLFLGRTDEQVKVRGFRIEPGEVESALAQHPAVRQAVVVAREDAAGDARLVAYVVPVNGHPPTAAELRQTLRGRLPEYMVPSTFVCLPELPRTISGKVDRRALPAPEAPARRTASGPLSDPVERFLATLWEEVLGVGDISGPDSFFDLGGTSLQVALLIHRLQDRLGEYVYTVALYDAPTLTGLAVYLRCNYPKAVARLFGPEAVGGLAGGVRPVDEARVTKARQLLQGLPPRCSGSPGLKNPRAVFVLSPPRSGSTLFRVLLGGHPQLFAPPELQLLNFDTLAQRHAAFDTERDRFWLDGTVRAIMEARRCDADEGTRLMEDCERRNLSVKDFYGLLQEWIGNSMFVDKTPTYALDPQALRRAEEHFDEPLYVHLIRHPSPVISSFEEAKLHVFFPPFFRGPHPFGVNELAELVWLISQQNIREFLKGVPAHRQHAVRFEELVKRPEEIMAGVARFLGVPFHSAMTDPFRQDHKSRMTDGVHKLGRMLGDVKFHEHKGIEAGAAERKKGRFPEEALGGPTRKMARVLGYPVKEPGATIASNGHAAPVNAGIERCGPRCLVRLQTGDGRRPLFCVHPAGGTASCYGDLIRHLGPQQPVFGFQAPGLAGGHAGPVRLEALAARYLEELCAVQPQGPYQLAGWSVGGVIAFDMARQLSARGQEVDLLALFDSDIPCNTQRMKRIDPERILAELARPFGLDTQVGGLTGEARLLAIVEQARAVGLVPASFTPAQLRRLFRHYARVFRANVRAVRRYVPQPLALPLLLFRPADRSVTEVTGPKRDWASLAAAVTVCPVPGDHFSMMREPYVCSVAEQLGDHIAGAESRVASGQLRAAM